MLKNKDGERGSEWSWGQQDGTLKFLRNYFGHASPDPVYASGKYKNYYSNGQLEWEASYENGKLDGNRKIYYANGILWQNENYKQGKKDGVLQRFGRSGQLMDEMHYVSDVIRYSCYWYDTSYESRSMALMFESRTPDGRIDPILWANPPVIQKSSEAIYDEYGNYHSKRYNRAGWLEEEIYRYDSSANKVSCQYNKDGMLEFEEIVTEYNERIVDKKWNEKGELISDKEWVKGKYLGDKLAGKTKDGK
jgi:antitoxin component YwqK of YwqJK toxin-antitoxin module